MALTMMKQSCEDQLHYIVQELSRHERHLAEVKAPDMSDMTEKELRKLANQGTMFKKMASVERERREFAEARRRILHAVTAMELPIYNDAAVVIQRIQRGRIGRAYAYQLRNNEERFLAALVLQRWYRRLIWMMIFRRAVRAMKRLQKMMVVVQLQRMFRQKKRRKDLHKTEDGRQELRKEMYRRRAARKVEIHKQKTHKEKQTQAAVIVQKKFRSGLASIGLQLVMAQRAKRKMKKELAHHLVNKCSERWYKVLHWRMRLEQKVRATLHPKLSFYVNFLTDSDFDMVATLLLLRKDPNFCECMHACLHALRVSSLSE
jgi:hypothetical protein